MPQKRGKLPKKIKEIPIPYNHVMFGRPVKVNGQNMDGLLSDLRNDFDELRNAIPECKPAEALLGNENPEIYWKFLGQTGGTDIAFGYARISPETIYFWTIMPHPHTLKSTGKYQQIGLGSKRPEYDMAASDLPSLVRSFKRIDAEDEANETED